MITAVAPSPSVDVTYVVPDFRIGAVNRPAEVRRVPGGKGINVARAAQRLGAEAGVVAILGGPGGSWIRAELARLPLPLHAVTTSAPTRTCLSVADGEHTMTEVYEPAAPVAPDEWAGLVEAAREAAGRRPGWVTVSGSLPPGAGPGALSALVGAAREAGRAVAVDVHGPALRDALEARPDVVKVNASEAAEVLGAGSGTAPGVLAVRLAAATRLGAVVTAGVEGAVAVTPDGAARRVRSPRRGPFPVGSGDCFLAGLVTGLDDGLDLFDALARAGAAATANAMTAGPACFTDDDLRAALADLETAGQ